MGRAEPSSATAHERRGGGGGTLQVIQFDVSNDTVRKQITMELRTLHNSHHAFIVRYYQATPPPP